MIYTLTLNPAIDYVVGLNHLQPGQINRLDRAQVVYGGKGINVSTMLGNLGIASTALGFIAGFTGDALADGLASQGICCRFVRLPQGMTRINIKIHADAETELNAPGPDIPKTALDLLFRQLDELTAGDTLVLAGSVPPSLPADIYEQILARLTGRGVRFVVDAAGELLKRTLPYRPFLIKPNHLELAELVGRALDTAGVLLQAGRDLQRLGARNILISRADDGALLLCENGQIYTQPAFCGQVMNSVGAGDATVAGFLAGIDEPWDKALRLACACGSATAFSAGLADKDSVEALLDQA